ncbi:MAG: multiheme c-type cytochrome [Verrucomicrobiia bacterium]
MKTLKYAGRLLACIVAIVIGVVPNLGAAQQGTQERGLKAKRAVGVCPPFKLRDEKGNVIDPVNGVNANTPYSPKQTCGASGCHDYNKITEGFHFTQGKGEPVPKDMAERYLWVSSPGNYGGNWCSPAPLYRQLAAKTNRSARVIDMTSFEFVTATCGNCHPGGGPLEYDREGKRYDLWMSNPTSKMTSGGDNNFDGDYYKARWSETGVIEADCLLCHLPEYDFKKRNSQLAALNFKWAATEASGLGKVIGAVINGQTPTVEYDVKRFDTNGNVAILHIVPEPRNETCLTCHAKPNWKKRGASFSTRTDVHIAAGLRCVDCHAAGSKAADPRIREREAHQFGKGDCPSGWVRNDLDNTLRSCFDCHITGWNNASRANHAWLPPLHMEKIACQTCHIPYRFVKSALVQASDAFINAPYITPAGKRVWTFYDQEMNFWNHYGELEMFTQKDQPTDPTLPTLFVYKGKIYPGNRVHSMWVGYEENGKPGLNQLFMKDFYTMWKTHFDSKGAKYPQLSTIKDDNGDGAIEVNRPEEIDALLSAVKQYLTDTGFPLDGKRLVWVSDDKAYYSSKEFKTLPRKPYEATPYASVYKFSHDVAPAKAALGARGCVDCHSFNSRFFERPILAVAFSETDARPLWMPNYTILGYSKFNVWLGAFREQIIKPIMYGAIAIALGFGVIFIVLKKAINANIISESSHGIIGILAAIVLIIGGIFMLNQSDLLEYMIAKRITLDSAHFWISLAVIVAAILILFNEKSRAYSSLPLLTYLTIISLVCAAICGALMILKIGFLSGLTRICYTCFDVAVAILAILCALFTFINLIGGKRAEKTKQ